MRQSFPIVPFICLCSSDTEKQLCPGSTAQFPGLHFPAHAGPSPWNASASPLPLQIPTLDVGHSSDISFHEASAVLLQSKEIHLSSDSHSSLFQFIFHFVVSLSVWVIVIYTSVFSSSYHSCERGVFVFNLSQCLAYGRC